MRNESLMRVMCHGLLLSPYVIVVRTHTTRGVGSTLSVRSFVMLFCSVCVCVCMILPNA